jgi:AcrR family transcriptional regulator
LPLERREGEGKVDTLQERILDAAYPLFTHHGIRGVSADDVRRGAAVSADEFDAAFSSMTEIAEACLARREQEWTIDMVESGARKRGNSPEARLLGIFDVFDEWFHREDFEACTFINVLLEMGRDHELGRESVRYLERIRAMVAHLAEEARLERIDDFARSLHILMKGSIVSAAEGDQDAARRARQMAEDLVARHRRAEVVSMLDVDLDWVEWDVEALGVDRGGRRRQPAGAEILDVLDLADLDVS